MSDTSFPILSNKSDRASLIAFCHPRFVAYPPRTPRYPRRANSEIPVFDVKLFLDSTGLGRRIGTFRKKETVFAQGDPAKSVMYIQEGGVKLTVVNEVGKQAVVAILVAGDFFEKDAWPANPFAWRRRPRLHPLKCSSSRKTR
jgi:hypothetical protein